MRERVEIVAHPDPAFRAGLEGRGTSAAEGIEDDVPGPRIARDEGVREGRGKAREVGAHRVIAVAPQPLLLLPFRGD